MDGNRFDDLTRSVARLRTRRALLRALGLALGAVAVGTVALDDSGDAATCRKGGQICGKNGDCCNDLEAARRHESSLLLV